MGITENVKLLGGHFYWDHAYWAIVLFASFLSLAHHPEKFSKINAAHVCLSLIATKTWRLTRLSKEKRQLTDLQVDPATSYKWTYNPNESPYK